MKKLSFSAERKKLKKKRLCIFNEAYIGFCRQKAIKSGMCASHRGITCHMCSAQATQTCSKTGNLVCGAPLCRRHSDHFGQVRCG